jgi:DNA-binding XRE family transcriptional regulator
MLIELRALYQRLQGQGMVAHLPWLSLKHRAKLPAIPAVYYVLSPTEMLYIGSTHNLQVRWQQHQRFAEFQATPGPITIAWQDISDALAELRDTEQAAIRYFTPRFNTHFMPYVVPKPLVPQSLTAPSSPPRTEASAPRPISRRQTHRATKLPEDTRMRHALITARETRGWNQQYVADVIQKDRSSIAHYERGDCDIPGKVLEKLAVLYGLPIDVLVKQGPIETPTTLEETS